MTLHAPRVALTLLLGTAPGLVTAQASRVVIAGVPFISWEEAARLDYANKDVQSPSLPAALGMILRYWGHDLSFLKGSDSAPGWAVLSHGENSSLDSLKRLVARGIPVVVHTAETPLAHQVVPQMVALVTMLSTEGLKLGSAGAVQLSASQATRMNELLSASGGYGSGVLGTMWPLDTLRRWDDSLHLQGRREILFQASRVLIGYDDDKRVVLLHCASFGPAWEVSYEEFDKMWSLMDRSFVTIYPKNAEQLRAAPSGTSGYAPRSPRQVAAAHFMYGYALARMGQLPAATTELRAIQALGDVGKGYEHLAWLELAGVASQAGDMKEAMAAALKARDLLPEHHRSWMLVATLFQTMRVDGETPAAASRRVSLAADAWLQAQSRCRDPKLKSVVAKKLPHDFPTFGCDGLNPL